MDEEKLYISSKLYRGIPMDEHTFLIEVKKEYVPPNSVNKEGYKVTYPDGYVSWSPAEAFETANREVTEAEKDLMFPKTQEAATDPADTDGSNRS